MKLTYWEISIIKQAIGILGRTTVAEMATALSVLNKINNPSFKQSIELFNKAQADEKLKKHKDYVDIFEKSSKIKFDKEEISFINQALENPVLVLPIRQESQDVIDKFKKARIELIKKEKEKSEV